MIQKPPVFGYWSLEGAGNPRLFFFGERKLPENEQPAGSFCRAFVTKKPVGECWNNIALGVLSLDFSLEKLIFMSPFPHKETGKKHEKNMWETSKNLQKTG